MGLETIVEEIKAKGRAEADRINAEADKEVSRIIEEAKSRAAKIKTAKQEEVKKEISRLRQQELSSANLEVKRALLNARKEVLDEVYEKARDAIREFPAEKNQRLLKAIIEKNAADNMRIYSNSRDKPVIQKVTKLKYAGEIDCIGGVLLENEKGTEYLDFKYETILKNISERSLKQVSDILFG
jgi:V/A-type H+-transporting ATPase subunit E